MKYIPLTQGKHAIVDDEDFNRLNQHKWFAEKNGKIYYAARSWWDGKKDRVVKIHREILGLERGDGLEVDHINRDGLDNRRSNLRIVSHSEQMLNRGVFGEVPYRGVCWAKTHRKYLAQIRINGKTKNLGFYDDPTMAAEAYRWSYYELYGEPPPP